MSRPPSRALAPLLALALALCAALPSALAGEPAATTPTAIGRVVALQPAMNRYVDADARIELLAQGFTWAEGPTWVGGREGYLLFTDVPENTLYRWRQGEGLAEFLKPSGYAGADDGSLREAGANGLYTEPSGTVLLADSGNRSLMRLDPATRGKTELAARFNGKRFNSPNDMVRRADGRIYFTDPPYGLAGIEKSPLIEQPHSGVYRLDPDGSVHLIDGELKFPNGVALSPDGNTLYVSNSDPRRPIWKAYTLDGSGRASHARVLADASREVEAGLPGLPDGMSMAADGTLFASGPGGLWILRADGTPLGRIETGQAIANCAFGGDGRTLYLTSKDKLARVRVKVAGLEFAH